MQWTVNALNPSLNPACQINYLSRFISVTSVIISTECQFGSGGIIWSIQVISCGRLNVCCIPNSFASQIVLLYSKLLLKLQLFLIQLRKALSFLYLFPLLLYYFQEIGNANALAFIAQAISAFISKSSFIR